jgi:thiol-disulfide isomerase/thioredoxin
MNFKNFLPSACFFLFFTVSQSQESIQISGQLLNNTRFASIVVEKFGIGYDRIGLIPVNQETGSFSIEAPGDIEPGVYRFRYTQTGSEFVDVIINAREKHIHFTLDIQQEPNERLPVFQQSTANNQWYQWQNKVRAALLEISLMEQLLADWPNTKDSVYGYIENNRNLRIAEFEKQRQLFINDPNHDSWAIAMIKNKPNYFTQPREDWRLQDFHKRNNYWQNIETNKPELINTPLYTDLILNYMMYYMNPEMSFSEEEMVQGFKKSADTVIRRFSNNETTRDFAIRYLQKGFKEIGKEEVLQYIDQRYAAEQCTDGDIELKNRLAGYEALKPGNPAPEIKLRGTDSHDKNLFDFKQDKILLVFWASWCPHCMEEMPKVQEWAKNHPETLVLAISLDEDLSAFQKAIQQFPDLLHYCDALKWEGEIVKAYYIAATPTFFLLDGKRKILDKAAGLQRITGL